MRRSRQYRLRIPVDEQRSEHFRRRVAALPSGVGVGDEDMHVLLHPVRRATCERTIDQSRAHVCVQFEVFGTAVTRHETHDQLDVRGRRGRRYNRQRLEETNDRGTRGIKCTGTRAPAGWINESEGWGDLSASGSKRHIALRGAYSESLAIVAISPSW